MLCNMQSTIMFFFPIPTLTPDHILFTLFNLFTIPLTRKKKESFLTRKKKEYPFLPSLPKKKDPFLPLPQKDTG